MEKEGELTGGWGRWGNYGGIRKDLSIREREEPKQGKRTEEGRDTSKGSNFSTGREVERPIGK